MGDSSPPATWHDLGEPRFFQQIAVADPTKSGSINKCFEMIIQESMAEAVEKDKLNGKTTGWADGLNLIKRIAANSTYITEAWHNLDEPRFFQQIAVADPTKSGSINKCFEMIIQESMAEAIEKDKLNGETAGWADGLNLIKRIAANSRYITDSAGKVPQDVANGNTAAGMCIDFYGRSEAEWTELQSGMARVVYISPRNGTSVSPDPIQLLRGSQNPQAARAFIEFVLSKEGQKLWDFRVGTPGGPLKYALRRTPIRKDMFVPEYQRFMSDENYDPYRASEGFQYHADWTGPYFNLIRTLIKCIALDPQPELSKAWQDIVKAGGPEAVPQAMAELNKLPFSYTDAKKNAALLSTNKDWTMLDVIRLRREWTEQSRLNYLKASQLAEEGK